MKPYTISILVVVASAFTGFVFGSWLSDAESTETDHTPAVSTLMERSKSDSQTSPESQADGISDVLSVLGIENPLERASRLHDAIEPLDSTKLEALMRRADKLPEELRRLIRRSVFARWLQIDRSSAERWARPSIRNAIRSDTPDSSEYGSDRTDLTEMWISANPLLALDEILRPPCPENTADWAAYAILAATGGDNPAALDKAATISDTAQRDATTRFILEKWAGIDAPNAFARINQVDDRETRMDAARAILGTWLENDTESALKKATELILGKPVDEVRELVVELAGRGKRAAVWALTLPEELRAAAAKAVFKSWANNEPMDALAWAKHEGLFDIMDASDAPNDFPFSNEATAAIAAIPPGPLRTALLGEQLHGLSVERAALLIATEPAEKHAELWSSFGVGQVRNAKVISVAMAVLEAPMPASAQAATAKAIGRLVVEHDTSSALANLSNIKDSTLRDMALVQAIPSLDRDFPAQTEKAVDMIIAPERRDEARAAVFLRRALRNSNVLDLELDNSSLSDDWKQCIRETVREPYRRPMPF